MIHTPFANLSDEELSTAVANKTDANDLEIELMIRIDRLVDEKADLLEQLGARRMRPEVKYVHA